MKYTSKVDLVYKSIVNGIKKGDYLPGDRIVISRVARENGCSEIPVREALRRLESEKLVELVPNRGALVTRRGPDYAVKLCAVRALLEGYAMRLAAAGLPAAELERLRGLAGEMACAFEAGQFKRCAALNQQFHRALYRRCGNEVLVETIEELWSKHPGERCAGEEHYRPCVQQHFDLLDALAAGDGGAAERIIWQHGQDFLGLRDGRAAAAE